MTQPPRDDFRSDVVGSTAHRPFAFILELQFGGKAKVSNLDAHGGIEEDVGHLEVSVDDLEGVQVCDGLE